MPATRATIGWTLANMIGADAGIAAPATIFKSEDGILDCYGITVPTDGTTDPHYAPGCTFRHVDGEVVATGTVDSADATSLIDLTLATSHDSNDELIGCYVVDTNKRIYGLIDDYAYATGDITVNDWLDYDDVAAAATYYPAAGDAFVVIRKTSGSTLYVNNGNDITGCKFQAVTTVGMDQKITTDMQDGPSQAIWEDVDLQALRNMQGGFLYENDFMEAPNLVSGEGWTLTQVTTGTIAVAPTDEGGSLIIDTAGHANAHDGLECQLTSCAVLPAAGKKIYFEARVKMLNTGLDEYFVGLAAIDTSLMAAGKVDDVVDKVGFFRDDGTSPADDRLNTITARTTAEAEGTDKVVCADDTWIKLGFVIDGLTSIKFYANGKLVDTVPVAETANIPNALIYLSLVAKCDQTSTDAELTIDWVRVAQVGTRNA